MLHRLVDRLEARRNTRTPRRRSAFTLLEMLLVVMLIGILMTGGAIAYSSYIEKGRKTTTLNTLRILKQALEEYASEPSSGGAFPTSLSELVPKFVEPQSLRDAWNREFVYYPNQVAAGDPNARPFTLYSRGKSGQNNAPDNLDAWNPQGQPAN